MEIHRLYLVVIFSFSVVILPDGCDGYCFTANLMAEMTVSGRPRYYCEYTGTDGHFLKLFPGSKLYLVDQCLDCTCTMDGLSCCGFGHAAGDFGLPKDCKMLHDGCQPLIVKTVNRTLDCFTGKPINFTFPHQDNVYASERSSIALKPLDIKKPIPSTSAPVQATTTAAAPAIAQTATPELRPVSYDGIFAPTMADFFRYLMLSRSSTPNQAHTPQFLQYLNTGNTPPSPAPMPQPSPPTNNAWQYDNVWPWFLFI